MLADRTAIQAATRVGGTLTKSYGENLVIWFMFFTFYTASLFLLPDKLYDSQVGKETSSSG